MLNMIGQCLLVGFLFDMQISLILKTHSIAVHESSCENTSLLVEAKCHAVWKMVVEEKRQNYIIRTLGMKQ